MSTAAGMDLDTWWGILATARTTVGDRADDRDPADDPLPDALTDLLAALKPTEIVEFGLRHGEVRASAYHHPLWYAAYIVEGGCGDDGFMDFRDGLILLGRDTFTRAVEDPDTLADLPVVLRMSRDNKGWIGYESLSGLIRDAYQRATGEADSYDAALEAAADRIPHPRTPTGPTWDPEDDEANRHHLPRLTALFTPNS